MLESLDEEWLGILSKIKCGGCKAEVKLETIRQQGVENWKIIKQTGIGFCPGCSHLINN